LGRASEQPPRAHARAQTSATARYFARNSLTPFHLTNFCRWNERAYNIPYLKTLRATLDASGFNSTLIVAPDSGWSIAKDILSDPELAAAVHGIGAHYPGMYSSSDAESTGKPLWASEDDSTYDNDVGAECWARIINRNFVLGNMTATINCALAPTARHTRSRTPRPHPNHTPHTRAHKYKGTS
jgi:hypothetical protein